MSSYSLKVLLFWTDASNFLSAEKKLAMMSIIVVTSMKQTVQMPVEPGGHFAMLLFNS